MIGRASVTHQECVESFTVEKYILGELSLADRDRFEEHYFECVECADAVRLLSLLRKGTQAGMSRRTLPVRAGELRPSWLGRLRGWWPRPQFGLASALAAVSLAAVIGYQNVQLRNQLRPQTVQSMVLPPATRGELPVLHSQVAGTFVLLEADLPSASGQLTWTVRSSDGETAFESTGPAPEPGLTLKVLLPSGQLQPGEYALTVRSNTGNEWLFQFRVGAR